MAAVVTGIGSSTRAPRWVVATFVGSLALNLAVIGAIASSLWREGIEPSEAPAAGRVSRTVVGYASTLPAERGRELKRLAEEQWREAELVRRALQKARTETVKALTAAPFDKQRYLEAQSYLLAVDLRYRQATTNLNNAIGLNLTPDERRGFLGWREQQKPPQNPLDVPERQGGTQ
jgi:Heavy-metal resistance